MTLTVHAVEQYIARHRPGILMPQATSELRHLVKTVTKVGPASNGGDEYECEGGLRIVVKRHGAGGAPTVVTVLPPAGHVIETSDAPAEAQRSRQDLLTRVYAFLRGRADRGRDPGAARVLRETAELWTAEGVAEEWDRVKSMSRGSASRRG